jgi:hypothetical protein
VEEGFAKSGENKVGERKASEMDLKSSSKVEKNLDSWGGGGSKLGEQLIGGGGVDVHL